MAKAAKVVKTSNRGSKPGERRGGRQKGTVNKATATIREIAREYSAEAVDILVMVMRTSDSAAARIGAASAVLDRAYGKPSTVLSGDEDGGAVQFATEIRLVGVAAPR